MYPRSAVKGWVSAFALWPSTTVAVGLAPFWPERVAAPSCPFPGRKPPFVARQPIDRPRDDRGCSRKTALPSQFGRIVKTEDWSCWTSWVRVVVWDVLNRQPRSGTENRIDHRHMRPPPATAPDGDLDRIGLTEWAEVALPGDRVVGDSDSAEVRPGLAHRYRLMPRCESHALQFSVESVLRRGTRLRAAT